MTQLRQKSVMVVMVVMVFPSYGKFIFLRAGLKHHDTPCHHDTLKGML